MLECPICHRVLSKIDTQHLKTHNLSKDEYFAQFGNDAPFGYSLELKEKKSGDNHPLKNKGHSEETKAKVSEGLKKMWEEGRVSEKQRNAIGERSKKSKEDGVHFNTGKTHERSEEYRQTLSKSLIEYYSKNPRKKFSKERLSIWHSETKQKIKITKHLNKIKKCAENINSWATILDYSANAVKIQCNKCQNQINVQFQTIRKHLFLETLCHTCFPIFRGSSQLEDDLIFDIKNLIPDISIIRHDKQLLKTLELDIVIPEFKIAIEVDGLYWHSELAGYDKDKHLQKTLLCQEQGYKLIHIFENELILKRDIVLSRLASMFGITEKVYARKCYIENVQLEQRQKFYLENHIQGDVLTSKYSYGLFYNGELVALMSFGKPRFNKNYEWELLRYASKKGSTVIGGASKLLSYFRKQFPSGGIISYADRRWSDGNLYTQLGFEQLGSSSPAYWYFKKSLELYHRTNFQKHKLSKLLDNFDQSKTEWENMKTNKWNKIYDCGNLIFTLK